jgi:hypothetical protein
VLACPSVRGRRGFGASTSNDSYLRATAPQWCRFQLMSVPLLLQRIERRAGFRASVSAKVRGD